MKYVVSAGVAFALGACSFPSPPRESEERDGSVGLDGQMRADAGVDASPVDAPPCTPGSINLCSVTPRTDSFSPTANTQIDTSADSRCAVRSQGNGPELCVLYFNKVDIPSSVTVVAYGGRVLVLASMTTLTISGHLDASARRSRAEKAPASNHGSCAFVTLPENDGGGGGGGAGGTFSTAGGNGGVGDANDSNGQGGQAMGGSPTADLTAVPAALRGGCAGQRGGSAVGTGGAGGDSGGVVYLFARGSINIGGRVSVTGAGGAGGGNRAGGGGGGSGGYLLIESQTQSALSGLFLANGGGGGEGGGSAGTSTVGADPSSASPAAGGSGLVDGGDGGAGSTYFNGGVFPADSGLMSDGGGGGGGGGRGFIVVRGANRILTGIFASTLILP